VAPENQEATGPLKIREGQGVVADITTTPKIIIIGDHTISQVHLLSGSIGDLGWIS
jgi:hypothetical protein